MTLKGKALQAANQAMEEGRLFYVCTDQYGRSCNGGQFQHSLPTPGNPGQWSPKIEHIRLCRSGYHSTLEPWGWFGSLVWLAEVSERSIGFSEYGFKKVVSHSVRLLGLVRPEDCLTPEMRLAVNRPNLVSENLPYARLRGARLEGANLCKANLCGADLSYSKIDRCVMASTRAKNACFSNATLRNTAIQQSQHKGSDITHCNLIDVHVLNACLDDTQFSFSNLVRCTFTNTSMKRAQFSSSQIRECVFRNCDLSETHFVNAAINKCDFQTSDLHGANFENMEDDQATMWPEPKKRS